MFVSEILIQNCLSPTEFLTEFHPHLTLFLLRILHVTEFLKNCAHLLRKCLSKVAHFTLNFLRNESSCSWKRYKSDDKGGTCLPWHGSRNTLLLSQQTSKTTYEQGRDFVMNQLNILQNVQSHVSNKRT